MGSKKAPKQAAVAATARQSAVDIQRSQNDAAAELRRRRANQTVFAGEGSGFSGSQVLG